MAPTSWNLGPEYPQPILLFAGKLKKPATLVTEKQINIQKLDGTKTKIKTQRLLNDWKLMESGVVMRLLFYSQLASPGLLLQFPSIILPLLILGKGNQSCLQSKRTSAGGNKALWEVDQSLTSPLSFFHTQASWFQTTSNTSWFYGSDERSPHRFKKSQAGFCKTDLHPTHSISTPSPRISSHLRFPYPPPIYEPMSVCYTWSWLRQTYIHIQ